MSPLDILTAYGAVWTVFTILGLVWICLVYRDRDYPEARTPAEREGELVDLDEWR